MTQATDTDIRELKTAIDGNTRAIDGLIRATEANAKAIADLTLEMRVGFEGIKGQINTLDTKFDERTKGLGQRLDGKELAQRNIFTGVTVTIVGGILLTLGRFLFFGISIKP